MRSALLQLPNARTAGERRKVVRAAMRQLERAELYFDAVDSMELDDNEAKRALAKLRSDLRGLVGYLARVRSFAQE